MMSKYEEAFKKIISQDHNKIYTESATLLQELVDKETPKKPIKNEKLNHDQFSDLCPTCRTTLLYKSAGCHNNECRQRIDWRE